MSTDMPTGTVVLACLDCRQITVLGAGRWIKMDAEWRKGLRLLAQITKEAMDTAQEVMESPIEDPRWSAIS
jgi:hypothetical protein